MTGSPYAGLSPFTEEQAEYFFGRDTESEIIVANLEAAKLTLLYGPSGVGKSSVINAGVVHRIRRQARDAIGQQYGRRQIVVPFRDWRDDPLSALEHAVRTEAGVAVQQGGQLADRLERYAADSNADLLIVLDQFEEYFMYQSLESGAGSFATEFPKAVNHSCRHVSFLVSMREDSIAKLDRFKGAIPHLFDNYLRIDRLTVAQAHDAIVRPVLEHNRRHGTSVVVEDALVEDVLNQVRTQRVSADGAGRGVVALSEQDRVETPHLQLVMERLWDAERQAGSATLRLATLQNLGGAAQIVKRHVDAALAELDDEERDAAARVFQYLVTPAGTKIALSVEDLSPNAGMSTADLRDLLQRLSSGETRILAPVAPGPDQPPTRERYQIFHDVLAEQVLEWRNRYVAAAEQRAADARAWEARQRAEREARAASSLRRMLAIVVALLIASVVLAVMAWRQTQVAERATSLANIEKEVSKETAAKLEAADARNRQQQATIEALERSAEAAAARQAGQLAEAVRLEKAAEVERARAAAAGLEEKRALERAEQARLAAEAERLKLRGAGGADSPPEPKTVETQPEVVPTVPPEAVGPGPGSNPVETPAEPTATAADIGPVTTPTIAPTGNYRDLFRRGIEATNRKRWNEALAHFDAAIVANAVDTGERVNISGAGYFEFYAPKYFRGVVLQNLGNCLGALEAWRASEADSQIQKTALFRALEKQRAACDKR